MKRLFRLNNKPVNVQTGQTSTPRATTSTGAKKRVLHEKDKILYSKPLSLFSRSVDKATKRQTFKAKNRYNKFLKKNEKARARSNAWLKKELKSSENDMKKLQFLLKHTPTSPQVQALKNKEIKLINKKSAQTDKAERKKIESKLSKVKKERKKLEYQIAHTRRQLSYSYKGGEKALSDKAKIKEKIEWEKNNKESILNLQDNVNLIYDKQQEIVEQIDNMFTLAEQEELSGEQKELITALSLTLKDILNNSANILEVKEYWNGFIENNQDSITSLAKKSSTTGTIDIDKLTIKGSDFKKYENAFLTNDDGSVQIKRRAYEARSEKKSNTVSFSSDAFLGTILLFTLPLTWPIFAIAFPILLFSEDSIYKDRKFLEKSLNELHKESLKKQEAFKENT